MPKEEVKKRFKAALESEEFAQSFKSAWAQQMAELDRLKAEGYFDPPPNCPLDEKVLERELNEWDPIELIAMGCPEDEYSPENLDIRKKVVKLPELDLPLDVENLGKIIFETFDDFFGGGMTIAVDVENGKAEPIERRRKPRFTLDDCKKVAEKILAAQKIIDEKKIADEKSSQ